MSMLRDWSELDLQFLSSAKVHIQKLDPSSIPTEEEGSGLKRALYQQLPCELPSVLRIAGPYDGWTWGSM